MTSFYLSGARHLCFLSALALASLCVNAAQARAKIVFVSLGSGPTAGVYYPLARAICEVVNKAVKKIPVYCSVESTPGSIYNIEAVATGEIEFALVQSDVQFAAVTGSDDWKGRPVESIRSVMSLYPEVLTIVARPDSGVNGIASLKDKRVNIGPPGSGTRATWNELERAAGLVRNDLALATEFPAEATGELLCANKLDASVSVVGHPSQMVAKQLSSCALSLVGVTGSSVDKLIVSRPYFERAVIPAGTYGNLNDIATFGSKATLVTSADIPGDVVYEVVEIIMENFDKLREKQPILASLKSADMVRQSLTAPLHPGALKAYEELGLIK